MSTLVINIATIPDAEAGRVIHNLGDLAESGVYKAMLHLQNQQTGTALLPLPQHRIVAISVVAANQEQVMYAGSLDSSTSSTTEVGLLSALAKLLEKPVTLVTWRGDDFILPVLSYRFLKHGIACPALWNTVSDLQSQLSRQHPSAITALAELATVLGFPGNLGLEEDAVLEYFQSGQQSKINQGCEADVLNTYLIHLKLQHQCGLLSGSELEQRCTVLQQYLQTSEQPHCQRYADAWLGQQ